MKINLILFITLSLALAVTGCKEKNITPEPELPATLDILHQNEAFGSTPFEVEYAGGQIPLSIVSNRDWKMVPLASYEVWATVYPTSGFKDESTQVYITVEPNYSERDRNMTIKFSTLDGTVTRSVNIKQYALILR